MKITIEIMISHAFRGFTFAALFLALPLLFSGCDGLLGLMGLTSGGEDTGWEGDGYRHFFGRAAGG
jgi:hypothetical protein